jgi:hypothetical protein
MLPVPGWNNSTAGGSPVSGGGSTELPNVAGQNLRSANNISLRPAVLTQAHLYNLRNQTWAQPRFQFNDVGTPVYDVIQMFKNNSSTWPSNADDVNLALYANTSINDPGDLAELYKIRFNPPDLVGNPPGNSLAPMGYFIIDAMQRGASRLSSCAALNAQYPQNTFVVDSLPTDSTPGGPSCCAEFAGHVFFGGFSGEVDSGDDNSPRMCSYILFSQLVNDLTQISLCYQSGDPTNKDDSALADTDGGFVRLDGAYGICSLVNIENALVVLAANGVWIIQGANNYGFKATDYLVTKITTHGCVSPASAVVVDNALMYWGNDGIYNVSMDQFGDWTAENVTIRTINTFYNDIPSEYLPTAWGSYDSYEKKVRWIYGNLYNSYDNTYEIVLDLILGAYYKNVIPKMGALGGDTCPIVIGGFNTMPFQLVNNEYEITVQGVQCTEQGNDVVLTEQTVQNVESEIKYLIVTSISPTIEYTFGVYWQPYHYDWVSIDPANTGVDATSFLLTGAMTGGDTQRKKTITYITCHFQQTEDGYTVDPTTGDFLLLDQSGCQLQAQWDWTNLASAGQWTQSQEAYRLRRNYIPVNAEDTFNNGYSVVETRSKLRGTGKAVSLLFTSEPGKHLHLYGWAIQVTANQNV